jgi:hypothetical protein
MLFNVDIDFNEYDLYNFELEQKLNQKMMDLGYSLKMKINTQYDIIFQYFKLESNESGNGYIEFGVSFIYYSRDLQTFILEKVELSKIEKTSEIIDISNREEVIKTLPKNELLEKIYENGDLGGV